MMPRDQILQWLRETDAARLGPLWRQADETRRRCVGDAVHLRGLIEISNHCVRRCAYCGLRAGNDRLVRYRMSAEEILECARQAVAFGYGTLVLQSGEDRGVAAPWMAALIRRIKAETPLAVTLSLGERDEKELRLWREAGADRYLLRFETSNPALYARIHPARAEGAPDRIALLRALRAMGYETGSGVMIGIPGQTHEDLANDLEMFKKLDLDMIGVGPFIPHPDTPLGKASGAAQPPTGSDKSDPSDKSDGSDESGASGAGGDQAPNTELMAYKMIALTRLACPYANIPSTTALATLNLAEGRELGLQRGANIVMPNLTPPQYRALYEIYPAKACLRETADECHRCLSRRIASIGRRVGAGRGDSPNWGRRTC